MLLEYAKAFLVGGLICAVGQVLIDYTKLTPARILVSDVVAGIVLGGLGLYQPLLDFAGLAPFWPRACGKPLGSMACLGCSPAGLPQRQPALRRQFSLLCWRPLFLNRGTNLNIRYDKRPPQRVVFCYPQITYK